MPALRQSDRKLTIADIAGLTGSKLKQGGAAERRIGDIATLDYGWCDRSLLCR